MLLAVQRAILVFFACVKTSDKQDDAIKSFFLNFLEVLVVFIAFSDFKFLSVSTKPHKKQHQFEKKFLVHFYGNGSTILCYLQCSGLSLFFFACVKTSEKRDDAIKSFFFLIFLEVLVVFIAFIDFKFLCHYKK